MWSPYELNTGIWNFCVCRTSLMRTESHMQKDSIVIFNNTPCDTFVQYYLVWLRHSLETGKHECSFQRNEKFLHKEEILKKNWMHLEHKLIKEWGFGKESMVYQQHSDIMFKQKHCSVTVSLMWIGWWICTQRHSRQLLVIAGRRPPSEIGKICPCSYHGGFHLAPLVVLWPAANNESISPTLTVISILHREVWEFLGTGTARAPETHVHQVLPRTSGNSDAASILVFQPRTWQPCHWLCHLLPT